MAHQTSRGAYQDLVERLNRCPQGAPPSDLLYRILQLLFSEQEASLAAVLPIKPFDAVTASRAWKRPLAETTAHLDRLADRGILLDTVQNGRPTYVLPPPMAGFFEFSMMRVRGDIDQKLLGELFYQYVTVEDDFIKALLLRGDTQMGRVFVNEDAVPAELSLHVLDYERATHVARTASAIAVGVCYCRHKMSHVGDPAGRACDAPLGNCLTFNGVAQSLSRHGIARAIGVDECLDVLAEARERRLVQFGENVRENVSFICNCCGCCCEALIAARRFGFLHPVHTTAFLPSLEAPQGGCHAGDPAQAPQRGCRAGDPADPATCNGCGRCVTACPVEALSLVSAHNPRRPAARIATLDERRCLGCGVCVTACPKRNITLKSRPERELTPVDSVHRTVVMAIERGTLHDLVFDNRALFSHRAMAAILGVILRLPPLKQALASRQFKSRYLDMLIARTRAGRQTSAREPLEEN